MGEQETHDFRDIRDGAFAEMTGVNRKTKLYNERLTQVLGYPTLEEYWSKRWNLTKQYINQLIRSAEVAEDLVSSETIVSDELKRRRSK